MDIEKIVVRLVAETSQYEGALDKATRLIWDVTSKIERMGLKLKLPQEDISKQVTGIIMELQRLQRAADQINFSNIAKGLLAGTTLSNLKVPVGESEAVKTARIAGYIKNLQAGTVGPDVTRVATATELAHVRAVTGRGLSGVGTMERAATKAELAAMREALGIGTGTRGATKAELETIRALSGAGGERGATQAEINAIRSLLSERQQRALGMAMPPQVRPGVGTRDYERDRRIQRASGARFDLTGGRGGGQVEEEPGGQRWQWIPSILGGAVGRLVGGRLGGLGGMIGGGLGGPLGAVGGITLGTGLDVGFKLAEAAAEGVLAVVHKIGEVTIWAAKQAVTLGMEYQRTETMLQVMTGSKERGTSLYREIQQLGISTPYTTRQLTKRAGTLLGYGADPEDMIPILSKLGDIASGDEERLSRLVLAYGQVLSHGRLMGQEVRQFAEAGVGLNDFARTIGVTGDELREMMRQGTAGADIMIRTINRLTNVGGRFFGSSAEQMKTVQGAWSNLVERLEIGAGRLGVAFFEKFDIAGKINQLADSLANMENYIGPFLDWLKRLEDAAGGPTRSFIEAIVNDLTRIPKEISGGREIPKIEDINWAEGAKEASVAFADLHRWVKSTLGLFYDLTNITYELSALFVRLTPPGLVYNYSGGREVVNALAPGVTEGSLWKYATVGARFLSSGFDVQKTREKSQELFGRNIPAEIKESFDQSKRESMLRQGLQLDKLDRWMPRASEEFGDAAFMGGAGATLMRLGLAGAGIPFWGGNKRSRDIPYKERPPIDPQVEHFREKFLKRFEEGRIPGMGQEARFDAEIDLLNKAFGGPGVAQTIMTGGRLLQGATRGGTFTNQPPGLKPGAFFDADAGKWFIPQNALPAALGPAGMMFQGLGANLGAIRQAGMLEYLGQAEKKYGDRFETRLSAPMARGTAEAQDVINRAWIQEMTIEEKTLAVLEAMKADAKETKEIQARQLAVLERWLAEQPEKGPQPREVAEGG